MENIYNVLKAENVDPSLWHVCTYLYIGSGLHCKYNDFFLYFILKLLIDDVLALDCFLFLFFFFVRWGGGHFCRCVVIELIKYLFGLGILKQLKCNRNI